MAVDLSALNAGLDIGVDLIAGYPTISQAGWLLDFPGRRWSLTSRS